MYKIKKEKNLYINTTNLIQKDLISSKYVIGHCSTALVYSRLLGIKTLSIQPKLYKDLFDWDKFYIFKNYKITNLNSFKSLNKF